MDSWLLDTISWDIVLDVNGNIAVASAPYALAQDAASAIRTFQGEVYYDTNLGIPYWSQILGHFPPVSYMKAKFNEAALTVPTVVKAQTYIASIKDRTVTGQVQITDKNGVTIGTSF